MDARVPGTEGRRGKIDLLTTGSTVVFARKPPGSWLSEGVPYVVEGNGGRTVHFRNPATGGGTFDSAWAIEHAEFSVRPAAGGSPMPGAAAGHDTGG